MDKIKQIFRSLFKSEPAQPQINNDTPVPDYVGTIRQNQIDDFFTRDNR